jgi:hypothetical protein
LSLLAVAKKSTRLNFLNKERFYSFSLGLKVLTMAYFAWSVEYAQISDEQELSTVSLIVDW